MAPHTSTLFLKNLFNDSWTIHQVHVEVRVSKALQTFLAQRRNVILMEAGEISKLQESGGGEGGKQEREEDEATEKSEKGSKLNRAGY